MPIEEAPLNVRYQYQTQDERDDWYQSDHFLLRALEEGYAKISVQILGPYYSEIKPAEIDLTIKIPFVIIPKNKDGITLSESSDE